MLHLLVGLGGLALLLIALADAFDTIILARRAERIFRVTALFYQVSWAVFSHFGRKIKSGERRERFLGVYAPLSLLALLGLWALSIVAAFTLLHWATSLRVRQGGSGLGYDLYFSACSLVTLSVGDPLNRMSRVLMVVEASLGLGLLGLVVGYLPALYQAFADREQKIAMLDARAGSPPAASELLRRQGPRPGKLEEQLASWEDWASNLLETHLSYPMLSYFRSQHENQSWLGALITVMDASALTLLAAEGDLEHQARLTFAMGRHALADMVTVFRLSPPQHRSDRLVPKEFEDLVRALSELETAMDPRRLSQTELAKLREMYEPFGASLSEYFLMAIPGWMSVRPERDNWLRSSWDRQGALHAVSDPFQT
jgi:hypothetical protein